MMSQRCNLFNAGFVVTLPTLYFSRLKLKDSIQKPENNHLHLQLSHYFDQFEHQKDEHFSNLDKAMAFAKHFEITDFDTPQTVEEYFNWNQDLVNEFEERFPLGRIEHYYFLYARKLAEMLNHMGLIKTYCDLYLLSNNTLDLSLKFENSIKDCEYLVFKLMAPAALLSSEPRQNCFNLLYKQMGEQMQFIKNFNIQHAGDEELKQLIKETEQFSEMLYKGYTQCCDVLKDLAS